MIKLELDWAAEDIAPPYGHDDEDDAVYVEQGAEVGPSGWPTVVVYVAQRHGEEAYRATMALESWLIAWYGVEGDEANELANMAVDA